MNSRCHINYLKLGKETILISSLEYFAFIFSDHRIMSKLPITTVQLLSNGKSVNSRISKVSHSTVVGVRLKHSFGMT